MSRFIVIFVVALALSAALTAWTYQLHDHPRIGVDDANIFFVYASNLVDGHGFVYNAGGERVEGFTSLLWVLLWAAILALTRTAEPGLLALCVVLLAITHTVVAIHIDRLYRGSGTSRRPYWPTTAVWVYLLLVFSSPAYVTWTTITLMDTGLWGTLCVASGVFLLSDDERRAGRSAFVLSTLIVLLMLTRPESLALCPVLIVIWWARRALLPSRSPAHDGGVIEKIPLWPGITYVVMLAALVVWRLAYFGHPLPNMYYAKVSSSLLFDLGNGSKYLVSYARSSPVVAIAVMWVALVVSYRVVAVLRLPVARSALADRLRPIVEPTGRLAFLCAVLLAIPVLTGGDTFLWWRFYQPIYPLLILCLFYAARHVGFRVASRTEIETGAQRLVTGAILAAFIIVFASSDVNWKGLRSKRPIDIEFQVAHDGTENGERIADLFAGRDELPSLGVLAAGGVKRAYPGTVIDVMGLNNLAMGHSPGDRVGIKNHAAFDKLVFLGLSPDILLTRTFIATPDGEHADIRYSNFVYEALRGLPDDPEFSSLYEYAWVCRATEGAPTWVRAYFKRPLLDELRADSRIDIFSD